LYKWRLSGRWPEPRDGYYVGEIFRGTRHERHTSGLRRLKTGQEFQRNRQRRMTSVAGPIKRERRNGASAMSVGKAVQVIAFAPG
jgi:hypothetical protein